MPMTVLKLHVWPPWLAAGGGDGLGNMPTILMILMTLMIPMILWTKRVLPDTHHELQHAVGSH